MTRAPDQPPATSGKALTGKASVSEFRDEVYPLLPDWENGLDEEVGEAPHPDGRPWRKACAVCAFRTSDPQDLGQHYQQAARDAGPDTLFYCVHRLSDGYHRVCACFAAFRATERRSAKAALAQGAHHEG